MHKASATISRFSVPVTYIQQPTSALNEFFQISSRSSEMLSWSKMTPYRDQHKYLAELEDGLIELEYVFMRKQKFYREDVLRTMKRRRLRPALYEELIAFSKAYPDEQEKFPIVAFGSFLGRDEDVHRAALNRGRTLDIVPIFDRFTRDCCFLAAPMAKFSSWVDYTQPSIEELKQSLELLMDENRIAKERFIPSIELRGINFEPRDVKFQIFRPKRTTSTKVIKAELEVRDLRPALYEELIGFVRKYANELKQRSQNIIALGSYRVRDKYHPQIQSDERRRLNFYISHPEGRDRYGWSADDAFLCVLK